MIPQTAKNAAINLKTQTKIDQKKLLDFREENKKSISKKNNDIAHKVD